MKISKAIYIFAIILFMALSLSFRPGVWLVNKPPSDANVFYVKGWQEGCISGTNSYSLLYAPLLDKPFIKDISISPKEGVQNTEKDSSSTGSKELYKSGWNEGFTLCRFYQSSVYELMQFGIIILTLLFIGYQLVRKNSK